MNTSNQATPGKAAPLAFLTVFLFLTPYLPPENRMDGRTDTDTQTTWKTCLSVCQIEGNGGKGWEVRWDARDGLLLFPLPWSGLSS